MSEKIDALAKQYPSICSVNHLLKQPAEKISGFLQLEPEIKTINPESQYSEALKEAIFLEKNLHWDLPASLLKESSTSEIKGLLEKITFYVFPDVSPDATEQFFSEIKYERNYNTQVN